MYLYNPRTQDHNNTSHLFFSQVSQVPKKQKMYSFTSKEMPSPSSLFSAYASMSASVMLLRSMSHLIPHPLRSYLLTTLRFLIKSRSSRLTLVIEDSSLCGMGNRNLVFDAAQRYVATKVSPDTERLSICKTAKGKNVTVRLCSGETIVDDFDGIELKWLYVCDEAVKRGDNDDGNGQFSPQQRRRFFELSFHKKHKEMVLSSYVPMVLERAKLMHDEQRLLKMYSLNFYKGGVWDSVNLDHPATFETLAMGPELKRSLIQDLDRFVSRKEFYKKVGRAWKRGYLLYGPPGTGKSSLVAAMANYLRFDVYDLQLGNIKRDSDLRRLLLATGNRSILVIEDIDCCVDLPERKIVQIQNGGWRKEEPADQHGQAQLTLSGLLNFVDGLWSSCGDERIIIFTTNHKERLDPALLRPGRMDMHIHMSYCTPPGFKTLALNYLSLKQHPLFEEIEGLMDDAEVTPAQVAEEMMKSEDADVALEGLVKLLKRKKLEGDEAAAAAEEDGDGKKLAMQVMKKRKIVRDDGRSVRIATRNGWKKKLI